MTGSAMLLPRSGTRGTPTRAALSAPGAARPVGAGTPPAEVSGGESVAHSTRMTPRHEIPPAPRLAVIETFSALEGRVRDAAITQGPGGRSRPCCQSGFPARQTRQCSIGYHALPNRARGVRQAPTKRRGFCGRSSHRRSDSRLTNCTSNEQHLQARCRVSAPPLRLAPRRLIVHLLTAMWSSWSVGLHLFLR